MEDKWAARYVRGESLKRVAEGLVDPVTVWNHLRARGIPLRDKVEAQVVAATKYERKPFHGDRIERAYLMGLRYGDLHVVRHGRAVRVRVSTTHPAMGNLFEGLFSRYGHVSKYPRRAKLVDYEWSFECDLDESFGFLLNKPTLVELEELAPGEFRAFLAGFFDAEGSIFLHEKYSGPLPEVLVRNTDATVLKLIRQRLVDLGIVSNMSHSKQDPARLGGHTEGEIWSLAIWRFDAVKRILSLLPLRHEEKITRARIALQFKAPPSEIGNGALLTEWDRVGEEVTNGRIAFLVNAESALAAKLRILPHSGIVKANNT